MIRIENFKVDVYSKHTSAIIIIKLKSVGGIISCIDAKYAIKFIGSTL